MIKLKYYIRKEGKKSTKKGYILGTWLLGQQVLEAGIIDISGIVNIVNIADVADIGIDIADISTDIADVVIETGRYV